MNIKTQHLLFILFLVNSLMISAFPAWAKSNSSQTASLEERVESLEQSINKANGEEKSLLNEISALRNELESVLGTNQAQPPQLTAEQKLQLAELEKEVATLDENKAKLDEAVKSGLDPNLLKDSFDKIEKRKQEIASAIALLVPKAPEPQTLLSRLDKIEKKVADLESRKEEPKPEPEKKWNDYIKPDLKAFLYWKLDAADGADWANEFGVARAYFGAKVKPFNHFLFRLTFDAKARIKTAKGEDGDPEVVDVTDDNGNVIGTAEIPTTEVENSEGAYGVYLKYAYIEAYDLGAKGFGIRLGQSGFIGITQLEDYWGYRFQGPMILDREKYMSSTYIGASLLYKSPNELVTLQASAVNGEGYSKPERLKSKDGHFSIFFRPMTEASHFGSSFVIGGTAVLGKYDEVDGEDRRLRLGGVTGFVDKEKRFCLFTEIDYVQDPTSEAKSFAKKAAGMTTHLENYSPDITAGFLSALYAWVDFGLFDKSAKGVRLVGRYDYVDPNLDFGRDEHHRLMLGAGYVLNKHFQFLLNYETVIFGTRAGLDSDTGNSVSPDSQRAVFLNIEAKL